MTTASIRGRTERFFERSVLPYIDPLLLIFGIVVVWTTYITRHGLQTFYGYLFDDATLVSMITLVIVVGIPLLSVAFFLEQRWYRWFYFAGEVGLLAMEVLAQYYQGQASFTSSVSDHFPVWMGIDIATIARQPGGRWLVVVFLVMPSVVVVGFSAAAAHRIRQLRGAVDQSCPQCVKHGGIIEQYKRDLTEARGIANKKGQEAHAAKTRADGLEATLALAKQTYDEQQKTIESLQQSSGVERGDDITKDRLLSYLRGLEAKGMDRKAIAKRTGFSINTVNGIMGAVAQEA